jgi:glycerophosphoryl diester phosphodiesterase
MRAANKRDIEVNVWTSSDDLELLAALIELGVHGVICSMPELVLRSSKLS